jgi:hypothetical protein
LARIAPTNSTKLRWNVGSVNAIEKDINATVHSSVVFFQEN